MDGLDRSRRLFGDLFGGTPEVLVRAPGRVNLIGEHTDYNDGFVLPLGLPVATYIAARRRSDDAVDATSEAYGQARLGTDVEPSGWSRYPDAIRTVLEQDGVDWVGFDAAVVTDIPDGASLSSSAALEVALLLLQAAFRGDRPSPDAIALQAQRAEHLAVGLPSGIMDQLISARARAGAAQLIDCRTLEGTDHVVPTDVRVLALDTMTRRELAESAYADRRAACERVAAAAGVTALRDLDLDGLAAIDGLDATDRDRATHVIEENQRTLDAAAAMDRGDSAEVGRLMGASHASLRDLYEVSGPALDAMVDASWASTGCVGARMTGGGFAGCTVALVEADALAAFSQEVTERFVAGGGERPRVIDGTPSAGAEILDAP
ncbi:MAG: galactokinase [Actinomycetota bacterium]